MSSRRTHTDQESAGVLPKVRGGAPAMSKLPCDLKKYPMKLSRKNDLGHLLSLPPNTTRYKFRKSHQILFEGVRGGAHVHSSCFMGIARLFYVDPRTFELGDFFLAEKFRGKKCHRDKIQKNSTHKVPKYSEKMLSETIEYAKQINPKLEKITLRVEIENIPARKLYSRMGFEEVPGGGKKI